MGRRIRSCAKAEARKRNRIKAMTESNQKVPTEQDIYQRGVKDGRAEMAQELSKAKDDLKYFSGLHEKAHRETSEERDRLKAELIAAKQEIERLQESLQAFMNLPHLDDDVCERGSGCKVCTAIKSGRDALGYDFSQGVRGKYAGKIAARSQEEKPE